jgi:hypothetical protein
VLYISAQPKKWDTWDTGDADWDAAWNCEDETPEGRW